MSSNNFDGTILLDDSATFFGFGRANGASTQINFGSEANGGFTPVGATVTGVTSLATGVLVVAKDNGSTGTIYLSSVSGTFQNGENLTIGGTVRGQTTSAPATYQSTPTMAQIQYGEAAPNGSVTAPKGSLYIRGSAGTLHINTDGGTTWVTVTAS